MGVDFGASVLGDIDEWIVRWDPVLPFRTSRMIDVDPQEWIPNKVDEILAVAVRVVAVAAIAQRNVKVAIRSKLNRTTIVILERLIDLHHDQLGIGVGAWLGLSFEIVNLEKRSTSVLIAAVRVVNVEISVGFEIGVHRQVPAIPARLHQRFLKS